MSDLNQDNKDLETPEVNASQATPKKTSEGAHAPEGQPLPGGNRWKKPILVWGLFLVLAFTIINLFTGEAGSLDKPTSLSKKDNVTQNVFWQKVANNEVKECVIIRNTDEDTVQIKGFFNNDKKQPFDFNVLETKGLEERLLKANVSITQKNERAFWGPVFISVVPIILLAVLFYFFIFKRAQGGALDMGKSRAKLMKKEGLKVHFADVAGVEEAKEEVQEIVEFLRDPKRFEALGATVPKGVLLMGPPGTGKTLLAKAIAGEAEVPFFSISGSDFMEMFVGVGASRVRDMFEKGKQNAPCIIFIDEIDAIGRSRFTGIGGGHDEREQTLNAMLVEMDGFDGNSGVIVMAATNRADVLDEALTRPGRFDRQIHVDLPTVDGRVAILKIHAQKLKLADDVDLQRIARGTPGFSGADLANLLNEGALIAARAKQAFVTHANLEEARDKVLWGRERRSRTMIDSERRSTAWHESGHALVQILCRNTEPLHKVTIIPRGSALGATMTLPERDVLNHTQNEMKDMLVVACAGRVAERIYTGDLSTGASADIRMATNLARRMVCQFGMSPRFGFQAFGDNQDQVFLGRDMGRKQDHSEATAQAIDEEVSALIKEAYARCENMISDNHDRLEMLVNYLLEVETADGRDVEALVLTGEVPHKAEPKDATPVAPETPATTETPAAPETPEATEMPATTGTPEATAEHPEA